MKEREINLETEIVILHTLENDIEKDKTNASCAGNLCKEGKMLIQDTKEKYPNTAI